MTDNEPFRLSEQASTFYQNIFLYFKGADKFYRATIVNKLVDDAENIMYLIADTNRLLYAGTMPRIRRQEKALETCDRIRVRLHDCCQICLVSKFNENILTQSLDCLGSAIRNWYISDLKRRAGQLEIAVNDKRHKLAAAEAAYNEVTEYKKTCDNDVVEMACTEAEMLVKQCKDELESLEAECKEAVGKLYDEPITSDYTALGKVLTSIQMIKGQTSLQ